MEYKIGKTLVKLLICILNFKPIRATISTLSSKEWAIWTVPTNSRAHLLCFIFGKITVELSLVHQLSTVFTIGPVRYLLCWSERMHKTYICEKQNTLSFLYLHTFLEYSRVIQFYFSFFMVKDKVLLLHFKIFWQKSCKTCSLVKLYHHQ